MTMSENGHVQMGLRWSVLRWATGGRGWPSPAFCRIREASAGQHRPGRHRRKRRITGLAVATPHVIGMTDTCTVVTHLVTDEAMATGRQAGRYVGMCGAVVLPGSLLEDAHRPCRFCHYPTVSR